MNGRVTLSVEITISLSIFCDRVLIRSREGAACRVGVQGCKLDMQRISSLPDRYVV